MNEASELSKATSLLGEIATRDSGWLRRDMPVRALGRSLSRWTEGYQRGNHAPGEFLWFLMKLGRPG